MNIDVAMCNLIERYTKTEQLAHHLNHCFYYMYIDKNVVTQEPNQQADLLDQVISVLSQLH